MMHLTHGFNRLRKDNCITRQETYKFYTLLRLILDISRYVWLNICVCTHPTFQLNWSPHFRFNYLFIKWHLLCSVILQALFFQDRNLTPLCDCHSILSVSDFQVGSPLYNIEAKTCSIGLLNEELYNFIRHFMSLPESGGRKQSFIHSESGAVDSGVKAGRNACDRYQHSPIIDNQQFIIKMQ